MKISSCVVFVYRDRVLSKKTFADPVVFGITYREAVSHEFPLTSVICKNENRMPGVSESVVGRPHAGSWQDLDAGGLRFKGRRQRNLSGFC